MNRILLFVLDIYAQSEQNNSYITYASQYLCWCLPLVMYSLVKSRSVEPAIVSSFRLAFSFFPMKIMADALQDFR